MPVLSLALIALLAALHFYIMWFEMFAWERKGPKIFRSLAPELFSQTRAMAANQGLYNGFLAAGLVWSLFIADPSWARHVATFFLLCVAVAGIYGAQTVSKRIVFVQTVPAVVTLITLAAF